MLPADSEAWLQSFSLRAYRPMVRLISGSDLAFLQSSLPAPALRRYRAARRKIIRHYLKVLTRDFQRLIAIAHACQCEPMAFRDNQLSFIFGVLWIELRLVCEDFIPWAATLDGLLESVEEVAASARQLGGAAALKMR